MSTPTPTPPQMALDPALQQQSSSGSTSSYNYNYYPTANYAANQAQAQAASHQPTASGSGSGGGRSGGDDLATMQDALGSAGIDLRAEEESLHRTHYSTGNNILGDRTRTQTSISTFFLSTTLQAIAGGHALPRKVPDDAVNYLALATRMRLEELIEKMVRAAKHRENARFDREPGVYTEGGEDAPMWRVKLRRDVQKQLDALEKVEREEESRIRRDRKERQEAAANAALLEAENQAAMDLEDEDGLPAKKKRKKDGGPNLQAKNLSDDVRKKLSDDTASQAAGRKKYAWMTAGGGGSSASTPAKATSPKPSTPTPATAGSPTASGGWARAYVPRNKSQLSQSASGDLDMEQPDEKTTLTLRDAMFVVCGERGHGGGKGSVSGYM
ncbi:transcription initiation factor TFIID component TAF4 family-domain-containing protein [Flagelloscypha sp. PMI_526]|nr:transcription initiation factor TFIID component TAF4 family-domain-containing protein [Flagelloscypha sp. PMI_526]